MRVDKMSMLFEDLTSTQRLEMLEVAIEIVLKGSIPWDHEMVKLWMDTCNENEYGKFVLAMTTMPQRFLLSYIRATGVIL